MINLVSLYLADNMYRGDVWWLDSVDSFSQHLAYVNENNQVVLKVDTSSNVLYNDKRNSIRIESRDRYDVGSLWIVDLSHVPSGCSVSRYVHDTHDHSPL